MKSAYKQKRIPLVGVLVDTATGWGRRLVEGILGYERQHGPWHVWMETRESGRQMRLPDGWQGDGLIARVGDKSMATALKKTGIPLVNVSAIRLPDVDFPRVTTDISSSAALAYEHFRDRGLSVFGFVGPIGFAYVQRHHGQFARLLKQHGYSCHLFTHPRTRGRGNWDAYMTALEAWLHSLPKPVGIYAWAEDAGRQVIHACRRAGLVVPHDVAVLGSDYDEVLCNACHPPLSGILNPSYQIGHAAAHTLDQIMRGVSNVSTQVLIPPTEVVPKASTDTLAVEDRRIAQALAFVRDHACEHIQIADILRQFPMARRSLERKFSAAIGRTPFEEIRRIRIAKARELLAHTDLPMQDIADACGYAAYNYLTFAFKRETGMTPSAYRKQIRGG